MASRQRRFDEEVNSSINITVQIDEGRLSGVSRRMLSLIAACLILVSSATAQMGATTGQVNGAVFVVDTQGPSYVPGAKVTLSGAVSLEQEADQQGRFSFPEVVLGAYTLTAQFPGLEATQSIAVEAGKVVNAQLELKPSEVKTSVTVTASQPEVKQEVANQTISSTTVRDAPNLDERTESVLPLIPGVVRGPDGRINMKGARSTQSGALVNSVNVTDPATGSPGLDLPIDVVASVKVISNPYDSQYGKLTGAVSVIDTRTSNYEKFHFSIQNIMPRVRVRDGTIFGVGGATPRMTVTGPILNDRIAFTQSIEYRFIRTPVNSLPPFKRDTTLESVNSYTQFDLNLTPKQTATVSFSLYPQKLKDLGLNTFTPQPSTPDYHQRGYQVYAQHRYVIGQEGLLTSQFSYKVFDSDITPQSDDLYQLQVETTEGGFFNSQARRSSRLDLDETYQFAPRHLWGQHLWKIGLDYAHSQYNGQQVFRPVEIDGIAGTPIESISFTGPGSSSIDQHEAAAFVMDEWTPFSRFSVEMGARLDHDTVTDATHMAPRGGFRLAVTGDNKTILKGGAGVFYDRVPLMIASFPSLPNRTVSILDQQGQITSSTPYVNQIAGNLQNPRSKAWNLALSRQVRQGLVVQVGYEDRNTTHDFVVSPVAGTGSGVLYLANQGTQSYRELQIIGRYQLHQHVINVSYTRSKAYGDLNDFFQFFGNTPKPVIQADGQGRLSYDAPNRLLAWGELRAPWKLMLIPVFDMHTGFPYSVQDAYRDYVGPRNSERFPRFESTDLQVLRPLSIHLGGKRLKARAGFSVFNLFNHFNPRDVQNIEESPRFGQFFNNAWREYRGKFVFEF
jgi:outer membrane receptor for ferrienterochelin and colicin